MLKPVRSAAPVVAPVSLEEVRAHLRIDHTDEDPTLQLYIDAATGYLEGERGILGRVLVTQSWRQAYPLFTDPLLLPLGLQPVQSVTVIDYWDAAGAAQVVDEALYRLVQAELGPRIERTTDAAWPVTAVRDDAVTVEFIAGEDAVAVAAPIRQAMLLLIGHWYANRETIAAGNYAELPYAVTALLINHARIGFG
jgi:uncharacterized phiE125 gp8 family phage protein